MSICAAVPADRPDFASIPAARRSMKYGPWSVDVTIEFANERRAIAFERYLKSGPGVAFANRHLR